VRPLEGRSAAEILSNPADCPDQGAACCGDGEDRREIGMFAVELRPRVVPDRKATGGVREHASDSLDDDLQILYAVLPSGG
jgi:hypothetical protein